MATLLFPEVTLLLVRTQSFRFGPAIKRSAESKTDFDFCFCFLFIASNLLQVKLIIEIGIQNATQLILLDGLLDNN